MKPRIAVVQPATRMGPGSREANLESARRYAVEAVQAGAQLVVFPESFPGAWRAPITWTPVDELQDIAREVDAYVVGGFAEPLDPEGNRCFNTLILIGPDGGEIGRYRRTIPAHAPWVYKGGEYWDFDWVNGIELPVFETDIGRIGLLVCSEVYSPELSRILALKGAEIILMPAGLMGPENPLYETWRTLLWARAIENLAYTAMSSNMAGGEGGLAMICGPEEILLCSGDPGVHVRSIDLERVRWLREASDTAVGPTVPWRAKPGLLRDWRRSEVFHANPVLTEPSDTRAESSHTGPAAP